MANTPNLDLVKPVLADYFHLANHFNNNWDKIDSYIGAAKGTLASIALRLAVALNTNGTLKDDYIGGDGTAGRILRISDLIIENATTADEIKCSLTSRWNGDSLAETDDIGKGETVNNFALSANGQELGIKAAGLSGNCVMAFGILIYTSTSTPYTVKVTRSGDDLIIYVYSLAGAAMDLTSLVDSGMLNLSITYMTNA